MRCILVSGVSYSCLVHEDGHIAKCSKHFKPRFVGRRTYLRQGMPHRWIPRIPYHTGANLQLAAVKASASRCSRSTRTREQQIICETSIFHESLPDLYNDSRTERQEIYTEQQGEHQLSENACHRRAQAWCTTDEHVRYPSVCSPYQKNLF